jgi:hypothetical protein
MKQERIVIVAYKAIEDKQEILIDLLKEHVSILREQGFATDRPQVLMLSKDGAIIEIFEWKSKEAIEEAHFNPIIQALWENFAQICEYKPISEIEEAGHLFSEFTTL